MKKNNIINIIALTGVVAGLGWLLRKPAKTAFKGVSKGIADELPSGMDIGKFVSTVGIGDILGEAFAKGVKTTIEVAKDGFLEKMSNFEVTKSEEYQEELRKFREELESKVKDDDRFKNKESKSEKEEDSSKEDLEIPVSQEFVDQTFNELKELTQKKEETSDK